MHFGASNGPGGTALAEMRRLLAAMRPDGDEAELVPQPGLDGLNSLLAEVGRAGLPVELHLEGQPYPLPRGSISPPIASSRKV